MNAQQRKPRQLDYVEHMVEAIHLARSYIEGMSREDFFADKKTQQAVILNIQVLGEAATQIGNEYPPEFDSYERKSLTIRETHIWNWHYKRFVEGSGRLMVAKSSFCSGVMADSPEAC